MPKAPAMVTMTSHLMALRASCCVSVPDPIITAAASTAAVKRDVTPAVYRVIIVIAQSKDGMSRRKRGGVESSNTLMRANASCARVL